jgi:hypothetical protein
MKWIDLFNLYEYCPYIFKYILINMDLDKNGKRR